MRAKIEDKKEIAKDTLQVDFSLVDKPLSFTPGQYLSIMLPEMHYADERGNIRYFSICTPPGDGWKFSITTRLSHSAYKRSLLRASFGHEVELGTISGDMILPKNREQKIVMIAGGIGITPFMSMVRWLEEQKTEKSWPYDVSLFFANKNEENAPFLPELRGYERQVSNFKLYLSMTEQPDWSGYNKLVDNEMIKENIEDFKEAYYMVAGPNGAVMKVVNNFDKLGITPKHYKVEEFVGYK